MLQGIIRIEGKAPPPAKAKVTTDQDVCGHGETTLDTLLVDAKTGGVRDCVVEILKAGKAKYDGKTVYEIDQQACRFVPHVLVIPQRGVVAFKNSDSVLHNIRARPRLNRPFNLSITANKSLRQSFRRADRVKVSCDVHKWMSCWVVVSKSRFHAITDARGAFAIESVPPGTYEVSLWHETLGKAVVDVEIAAGAKARLNHSFEPKSPKG